MDGRSLKEVPRGEGFLCATDVDVVGVSILIGSKPEGVGDEDLGGDGVLSWCTGLVVNGGNGGGVLGSSGSSDEARGVDLGNASESSESQHDGDEGG